MHTDTHTHTHQKFTFFPFLCAVKQNKATDDLYFILFRVRFLLGGRHGDFKFLPPSSYAPCYEALLPKEKMRVEPVKEYKRDVEGVRDLLGTTHVMSQASFIPTPVETSQVSQ